jgi:hypothetical protein
MSLLFSLIAHLLVILAPLAKPGGLGAVVARSDASTSIVPCFGTEAISSGSSTITKPITTNIGVTPGWRELRLLNAAVHLRIRSQKVQSYSWQRHCHGLFETPPVA